VTLATFGAGTVPLQPDKVTLAGQVIDGGVVSTVLVYVWEQVAAFPQASHCLVSSHGYFGSILSH
jgi:hypothetical protein